MLAACGGGEASPPLSPPAPIGQTPSETPTPSPTPSATPSPAPRPTPTYPNPADDGVTVVVAEGDSISVDYSGYYAGYFKLQHPELEYHILAVGGSGMDTMVAREETVQKLNPDIVTVFIGANDLGSAPSARAYFDRLVAYVTPLRDRGSKVWVATNLPLSIAGNPAYTNNHNALRGPLADLLKQAVGKQIDGVIDFGGDPVMGQLTAPSNGQLYSDGVHPTERSSGLGGHDYLYAIYEQAMKQALEDLQGR